MVEISWTISAEKDLNDIIEYISRDSPENAEKFSNEILETIENLSSFPRMGKKVLKSNDPRDREILHQNYRIIYQVIVERIEIKMIIHCSKVFF